MEGKMYTNRYIPERLKTQRKRRKLSQAQLSALIQEQGGGTTRENIAKWESGKSTPDVNSLIALCNALECDLTYLLGVIDTPKQEVYDIQVCTGLSEKAVSNLVELKKGEANLGIELLSKMLESKELVETLVNINRGRDTQQRLEEQTAFYEEGDIQKMKLAQDISNHFHSGSTKYVIVQGKDLVALYYKNAADTMSRLIWNLIYGTEDTGGKRKRK